MEFEITSQNIDYIAPDGSFELCDDQYDINFDTLCPHCKTTFKPIALNAYHSEDLIYVTFLCPHCKQIYFAIFFESIRNEVTLEKIFPNNHRSSILPKEIEAISPGFIKIYDQASIAEEQQLDEISGMGYRKALEFLIRDYAISKQPDKKPEILSSPLVQCIKSYIDNDSIKTLATVSAWIGNDETHYLRHHEDRNINDLKKFIDTIVSFFMFEITLKDAQSITHKNKK
jgi:hypothetical protein